MSSSETNDKPLKMRIKFETPFMALLHGKSWRRYWDFCQRHNINYYLHFGLGKLNKKLKRSKSSLREFDLYAIGQSHFDACWLWTKLSSYRRAILTFQQAIEHFKLYPHFTFSQTSPQYYDWVKRLRPALFEKIQEYEKKGRWEILGGMWIEPDLNVPDGESLVRQRLYGQLFYLENFGKFATIECLPDSFGFNAQLPQILIKSGAKTFWTTKITWNDFTEFPFANFLWRGIDGSEIFTHSYKFNWQQLFDLSLYKKTARKTKDISVTFNSSFTQQSIEELRSNERTKTLGIFYGFGDGAMGPLREEIDLMSNVAKAGLIKFTTAEKYFEALKKECGDQLPVWEDELYLELHRGVYTSVANMKRLNRQCEINLRNCEILLTLFTLFYKNFVYPEDRIKKLWKDLLFNQFHDILPGSSIQDVYYEQERELEKVIVETNRYISSAMKFILLTFLKKQNMTERSNEYRILVNTLPWQRNGIIDTKILELPQKMPEFVVFEKLLPLSFKIVNIKDLFGPKNLKATEDPKDLKLINENDQIVIENSKLAIIIQKKSGEITSLLYKEKDRELIKKGLGIGFRVYREKKNKYPAWEIYKGYTKYPVPIGIVKGIQIESNTPFVKKIRILFKFQNTSLNQIISLKSNSDTIEFATEIDIHDKNLLFKTRFPFNLESEKLTGEIPYGNVKRKIVAETDFEKGKWEFPAQKYVDISESDIGITIVNNSKYGFSSNKKGINLTLLHTPLRASTPYFSHLDLVPKEERTKYIDLGFHRIEYAIWIHNGDFINAQAWKKAFEYNYPVLLEKLDKNIGAELEFSEIEVNEKIKSIFKQEFSTATISNPNVILQVMKFPEKIIAEKTESELDKKFLSVILRLYETSGVSQKNVELEFDPIFKVNGVSETDLLEQPLESKSDKPFLSKDRKKIVLNFEKFEIKTIKVSFSM